MKVLHWPGEDGWRGPASAVTIGVFDGMHLGHQEVFRQLRATAGGRPLGAVTFHPHPREVITGQPMPLLAPLQERLAAMSALGLDFCLVVRFSCQFAAIRADDFWSEFLQERLSARHLVIGYDLCIGHRQEADARRIVQMGRERGVEVVVVPAQNTAEGDTIKSTLVREVLQAGDVARARELLGQPFTLRGEVVRDRGLGRQIGFPTANLVTHEEQMLPFKGVYAALARVGDHPTPWLAGVNIGQRPTTTGEDKTVVEAHLLDHPAQDFYGETLQLAFVARLRDEKKFSGMEPLQAQLKKDMEAVRHLLKNEFVK